MDITFTDSPTQDEIDAVVANIAEASERQHPGSNYRSYGFLLKADDGTVVGGLTGYALYDWMFVQFLSVPEVLRGQGHGAALLAQAETWGLTQGLIGMWLDTFAFQAPEFYRRLGFTEFGAIEDHPAGSRRIFFQKRFAVRSA